MNILGIAFLALIAQNASIGGIVVRETSGPLSKAIVELRGEDNDALAFSTATTEDDGQFLFQSVRPGRYRLVVSRPGYVRSPLAVSVAAGQQLNGLRLNMAPTGAIYGRILDSNGAPLGNIDVQAIKLSYPQGQRVMTVVQTVQTNDLGEYRLFWLPPGRYYVAAVHPDVQDPMNRRMRSGGAAISGVASFFASQGTVDPALGDPNDRLLTQRKVQVEGYVPVYFSGTPDEELATAIDVRPGSDFGSADIVLAPIRRRYVRGVVIDGTTGRPAQYANVRRSNSKFPRSDEVEADRSNATFEMLLPPGRHHLKADAASGSGSMSIQIGDADIQNVTIVTRPAIDIPGRITVEGTDIADSDLAALRFRLVEDPPVPVAPAEAVYSNPLPGGTFRLDATPGDYRVNIPPIWNVAPQPAPPKLPTALQNVYVKSIRMGAVDVSNTGLHLEKPPQSPLEIVLGTNPGIIEGTILNDRQHAADEVSVVLVPDARHRSELYATVVTGTGGRFRLDRIPPGDYKIFAWTDVDFGSWHDAQFLRNYESFGRPVRVREGSREDIRLTVFP